MNFTNTDCAKIQVYGQFQNSHVNGQVYWHLFEQVYLQVFYQFNPIQTKIKQKISDQMYDICD